MPFIRPSAALCGLLLAAAAVPSQAGLITFQFGGRVLHSELNGVSVGDRISGFYTFDSASVDSFEDTPSTPIPDGSGPYVGIYTQTTAAGFRINDWTYLSRFPTEADGISGGIMVNNDLFGVDNYGVTALGFSLTLQDPTATALNSDDLPLTPPDPRRFLYTQFYFGNSGQLIGNIDTLVVGPPNLSVPAPASLALVLAGLGALAASRRPTGANRG